MEYIFSIDNQFLRVCDLLKSAFFYHRSIQFPILILPHGIGSFEFDMFNFYFSMSVYFSCNITSFVYIEDFKFYSWHILQPPYYFCNALLTEFMPKVPGDFVSDSWQNNYHVHFPNPNLLRIY